MKHSIKEIAVIEVKRPDPAVTDMNVGDIAEIIDTGSMFKGHLILRTYDQIVSLHAPESTWTMSNKYTPDFKVRILKPGTKIEITVGGKE